MKQKNLLPRRRRKSWTPYSLEQVSVCKCACVCVCSVYSITSPLLSSPLPSSPSSPPTGGAYIPPAKLRMMQSQIQDKSSVAYQRLAWEALKKSINGLINKVSLSSNLRIQCVIECVVCCADYAYIHPLCVPQVNVSNIGNIVQELFQENVVRGR